jgi:hypothetical protein
MPQLIETTLQFLRDHGLSDAAALMEHFYAQERTVTDRVAGRWAPEHYDHPVDEATGLYL